MARARDRRESRGFQSSDGIRWAVEVPRTLTGASNAMVIFHHPDGRTARRDRYAWYIANTPEARNVTARLNADEVLRRISDGELARLFRRSMLISAADNPLGIPITHAG
jgi:hypothetical protein